MKKSKLFQSALSLMLVGGMLTACGSSASSTAVTALQPPLLPTPLHRLLPSSMSSALPKPRPTMKLPPAALTWKISSPPLTTSSSSSPKP